MAVADILIGPGRLYRAPVGEAFPDETTVAYAATWGGNWVDMGDFPEGESITISTSEEVTKVRGEQSTAVKKQSRTSIEWLIKGSFLEHTEAVLEAVLDTTAVSTAAGASQKAFSVYPLGVSTDVTEYAWGVEALRVDSTSANQPVRWLFRKGSIRMSGETPYSKQNPSAIPFEITVLEDDTQSAGYEIGELQIVTSPTTTT